MTDSHPARPQPPQPVQEIRPRPEFYEVYSEEQIHGLLTDLENYHEMNFGYSYFDDGADNWDDYARRLAAQDAPNSLTGTVELLEMSTSYLDTVLEKHDGINIIDIGAGNALPVRGLLNHLVERKKLGRYIALDISHKMLDIAERNIQDWFKNDVTFEGHQLDINREGFKSALTKDESRDERILNVALFLGGTPNNFRDPDNSFRIIHDSLRQGDMFIRTSKLDTDSARNFFDFSTENKGATALDTLDRFLFNVLNIDENLFEVERGYDPELRQRYRRIRFISPVKLVFELGNNRDDQRVVEFKEDDRILLWRAWHMTPKNIVDQLERNGFHPVYTGRTQDEQYMLAQSYA
jgi:uncharacterized SAM-dependent methyltransferase